MTRTCKPASLALLGGLLSATPTLAEDYRAEAGVWVARVDNDGGETGESFGLQGTYYFSDVGTDDVPLSEAAFLGRDSKIRLEGLRYGIDGGDHFNAQMLSSDIYLPTRIPLFLSAGLGRNETLGDGHDTAWNAAIGVTPLDGLRVSTRFSEGVDYQPNVDLKYVGKLGNSHWFGFGAELADPDFGDLYWSLTADYFLDETFKVGAAYNDGYEQWALIAEKFFYRHASIGISYIHAEFSDGLRLDGAWRF